MPTFFVTELDEKFIDHLDALKALNQINQLSTCLSEQRQWYTPPGATNPQDIIGLNTVFDRTIINNLYKQVISDQLQRGSVGEAMLLKIQLDYIAALERSYRTRHASSIRCKIHASSRRRGHGADGGLFDTGNGPIALWLTRMLAASSET